jgi:hypothetical protein
VNRSGAILPLIALCAWVLPGPVAAQSLTFSSGGGPLTLSITTATAGSNPNQVTDNSTEVTWDSEGAGTGKITVSTSCTSQAFGLYVTLAVTSWGSGTTGTEQSEVQLSDGMLDADIFRDIPTTLPARQGTATLTYRATATAAQGNSTEDGDDNHTVTYTIVAQ